MDSRESESKRNTTLPLFPKQLCPHAHDLGCDAHDVEMGAENTQKHARTYTHTLTRAKAHTHTHRGRDVFYTRS